MRKIEISLHAITFVDEITTTVIHAWIDIVRQQHQPGTLGNYMSTLVMFLDFLIQEHPSVIDINTITSLKAKLSKWSQYFNTVRRKQTWASKLARMSKYIFDKRFCFIMHVCYFCICQMEMKFMCFGYFCVDLNLHFHFYFGAFCWS